MNGPRPGAVIELLGAPGAGKSSLARALAGRQGVTVVKDHQRGDLPALAWSIARAWPVAVTPPPDVDRRRWASWAARVSAASHVARSRLADGAQTVVFDQGAAYTLVRMLPVRKRLAGNVWWSQRCAETADLLDLLVIVDADTATLAQRMRSRRKCHRADALSDERLHAYIATERRDCHFVADALAREGAEVVRLVTTELALEHQVATVLSSLDRPAGHPSPRRSPAHSGVRRGTPGPVAG